MHIDIIMDKMFKALYIKYNLEAPIHSLKIVILARLNVKMCTCDSLHLSSDIATYWSHSFVSCWGVGKSYEQSQHIFNIILHFGESHKIQNTYISIGMYGIDTHAIER